MKAPTEPVRMTPDDYEGIVQLLLLGLARVPPEELADDEEQNEGRAQAHEEGERR